MNQAPQLLIRLLAVQDSLFTPFRDPRAAWWPTAWAARWAYPTRGFPWRSGGRSGAAQKQLERALGELTKAKLAIVRRGRIKTASIRLTNRGDQAGRALANLPGVVGAVEAIAELHRQQEQRERDGPQLVGGFVPEVDMNRDKDGIARGWGDGRSAELIIVQDLLMYGLVRGWTESNSDSEGHVYYRPTPLGARIATGTAEPDFTTNLPAALPNGFELYSEALGDALQKLRANTERIQGIGEIHLPCSMGRLPPAPKQEASAC